MERFQFDIVAFLDSRGSKNTKTKTAHVRNQHPFDIQAGIRTSYGATKSRPQMTVYIKDFAIALHHAAK